jgi:hypothetical protein
MDENTPLVAEEEKFSLNFRVLGNEIFSVELASRSSRKNWIIFGLVTMVLLSILFQQLVPLFEIIEGMSSGN